MIFAFLFSINFKLLDDLRDMIFAYSQNLTGSYNLVSFKIYLKVLSDFLLIYVKNKETGFHLKL